MEEQIVEHLCKSIHKSKINETLEKIAAYCPKFYNCQLASVKKIKRKFKGC